MAQKLNHAHTVMAVCGCGGVSLQMLHQRIQCLAAFWRLEGMGPDILLQEVCSKDMGPLPKRLCSSWKLYSSPSKQPPIGDWPGWIEWHRLMFFRGCALMQCFVCDLSSCTYRVLLCVVTSLPASEQPDKLEASPKS